MRERRAAFASPWRTTEPGQSTRGHELGSKQELDRFLADVERRAFRMAELATGNTDDALDILQDAMFKLVQKYADRPREEWGPLFRTILQSRIRDYYRLNRVRNRFRVWFGGKGDPEAPDPVQTAADPSGRQPDSELEVAAGMEQLAEAVRVLPLRQQQAFMLRALEGLDVAATARAMGCSQGSVKTHYSRAIHVLREKLGDYRK